MRISSSKLLEIMGFASKHLRLQKAGIHVLIRRWKTDIEEVSYYIVK